MISRVISTALRIWLRSQVEQVEQLELDIIGRDRQILTGYIPGVSLVSNYAVYQGIHLGQVQLTGANIRINLAEILKRKPFRLLEPIEVKAQVLLQETQLQASLASPLLSIALRDLLTLLLAKDGTPAAINFPADGSLSWQQVTIDDEQLTLKGYLCAAQGKVIPIAIRTQITLASGHQLRLENLEIEGLSELGEESVQDFEIDLGQHVQLEQLHLESGKLFLKGGLLVMP